MTDTLRLSVLDLVPVRSGQTSAGAVAASVRLAQLADRLDFTRYWFAEHHNMPAVASTTPPVLIAATAARTERIRVGSGGVMLPNHAPLVVAEQFAALEALAPGRIDLGIGRAPGSDPVITQLLRISGPTADVDRFPDHVADILSLLSPDGASLRLTSGREYAITATPAATEVPTLWLLGSSDYSAKLAAGLGLPYVFANHFSGEGLERALELYRTEYQPERGAPDARDVPHRERVGRPDARGGAGARAAAAAFDGAAPHQPADAPARDGRGGGDRARPTRSATSSSPRCSSDGSSRMPRARPTELRRLAARHGIDEVDGRADRRLATIPSRRMPRPAASRRSSCWRANCSR